MLCIPRHPNRDVRFGIALACFILVGRENTGEIFVIPPNIDCAIHVCSKYGELCAIDSDGDGRLRRGLNDAGCCIVAALPDGAYSLH